jgi:hypothetical protein
MVTGSDMAGEPMSEPLGPGPPIPFEHPEQDLPGEMGMLLAFGL